jgi:carboxyl-terminal processing protease
MAFYYTPSGRSIQKPLVDMQLEHVTAAPRQEYKTDAGRIVRGGGGIDPDQGVTPPPYKRLEMVLDATGAYAAFATEYLRAERPAIAPGWQLPKPLLDRFRSWLSQNKIQPGLGEWFASSDWIEYRLRQEIVNLSLGVEEGDKVEAEREPWIVAALASIEKE